MVEMLTPEQVADYLQLNKETVYRLIREHRLAATAIGRTYRIPREDLEVFIRINSTRPLVRQRLFDRVMAIGGRNPDVDSNKVLADLENA